MMLKVIFVEGYYGLGEKEIEYEIMEGRSLGEFVRIGRVEDVGEEKRVWKVKKEVSECGRLERLLRRFGELLNGKGV